MTHLAETGRRLAVRSMGLVAIVVWLLMACQLPRCRQVELPDDGPPIVVSQESARRLVEKVTEVGLQSTKAGEFELTVTQEEVTSFLRVGADLADRLQAAGSLQNLEDLVDLGDREGLEGIEDLEQWRELLRQREGLPRIPLPDLSLGLGVQEPEVRFREDGQIIVRGYATVRELRQPVRVVVAPRVADGELVFDFGKGTLGTLSLPEALFAPIARGLARALLVGQELVEITQVDVREGSMTVRGTYTAQP